MNSPTISLKDSSSPDESEIHALYHRLLDGWNNRSASDMAALFDEDGHVVGFDGSPINGRAEIESQMRQIFADHQTAAYVGKIRGVHFLTSEVAVLRAVAGMVPPESRTSIPPSM